MQFIAVCLAQCASLVCAWFAILCRLDKLEYYYTGLVEFMHLQKIKLKGRVVLFAALATGLGIYAILLPITNGDWASLLLVTAVYICVFILMRAKESKIR